MKQESLSVKVMSSDGFNAYKVEFTRGDGKLGVTCDCAAGSRGKVCKHKLGLLMSNSDSLKVEGSPEIFVQIKEWVLTSSYSSLLQSYDDAVAKHLAAKDNLELVKYRLEKAMRDAEGSFS
jgi:hypothetical protein